MLSGFRLSLGSRGASFRPCGHPVPPVADFHDPKIASSGCLHFRPEGRSCRLPMLPTRRLVLSATIVSNPKVRPAGVAFLCPKAPEYPGA
jgi:hypothetical protein